MESKQDEKVSFRRIISNNLYILKYAFRLEPFVVIGIIVVHIFVIFTWAFSTSIYLKAIIECYRNQSLTLMDGVKTIAEGGVVILLGDILESAFDVIFTPRFTYMTGKIQKMMLEKATEMDLICYDNSDYYEDFVIAAKQSEEMVSKGVLITATIIGMIGGIIFVGGFMLSVNPIMLLFPAAGFVINTICVSKITTLNYGFEIERKRIMRKADYSKRVFYQPEYAKEIKLSHIEVPLKRQFDEAIDEVMKEAQVRGRKIAVLNLICWISVYTLLCYCFPPIYLGYLALKKKSIALEKVASVNSSQDTFRDQLNSINYSLVEFQRVGQYGEKFRRFMECEVHTENQPGEELTAEVPKELKITNMSFRYEGAKKDTLHNINMTIKPGQKIAIVGENGAGKTTFIKVLMHLYDITSGSITYDGKNICEYATSSYRKIFGTVFQDFQLYAATLGENVLMNVYETSAEENVRQALDSSDFTEKLNRLSLGTETELTREFHEEGTMLSGGEAQKVAISRLFAKKDKMMVAILDEPSSALDPKAEFILNRNMMEKSEKATVIFISHRLSTTRDADRIYMFEHGEIVEEGTHEELMRLQGGYAKMFEKQAYYYQNELEE